MGEALDSLLGLSVLEVFILTVNTLLLIFSHPIFNKLSHGKIDHKATRTRLHIFRAINILIIALILFYHLVLPISGASWATKTIGVLSVIFLSHLGFDITSYFILSRFGRTREVDGQVLVGETYNTRALRILTAILFVAIALIGSIQVLEFESLLQAGGVVGFVGVLLALTQASWAPDIISGLIILNSDLVEEGNVLQLEDNGRSFIGVVYKTKMFHTEILNAVNNHRIMIRNANLRNYAIHNLSKFASARGLRECMSFKISYDINHTDIESMFNAAFNEAVQDASIDIESQHPLEVMPTKADDYAVEWNICYYTKDIRNLLITRQQLLSIILKHAGNAGISLSTPMHHVVKLPPKPRNGTASL